MEKEKVLKELRKMLFVSEDISVAQGEHDLREENILSIMRKWLNTDWIEHVCADYGIDEEEITDEIAQDSVVCRNVPPIKTKAEFFKRVKSDYTKLRNLYNRIK